MAFQFGRVGRTLTLLEPETWDDQNGQLRIRGRAIVNPVSDAMRLRDQFLGYQENWDEPVVPVIVDSEPRLTGYYRVLGVSAATDARMVSSGYVVYDLQLQRVLGFTQPLLESIISGSLLTNAVGAVQADMMGFHGIPQSAREYVPPIPNPTLTNRPTADGVGFVTVATLSGSASASGTGRYSNDAVNFYTGAATFEQGSPLQPVIGRALVQWDLTNWRLSNGMVRVTPNASAGKLDVSHYNGATWSAVKTYVFSWGGVASVGWNSLVVLRNSSEETAIRLTGGPSATSLNTFDISLRRGDRIARFYCTASRPTGTGAWKLARDAVEAATAITYGAVTLGGIRATANDGDTNRYVLLQYQGGTPTNDLVNGALTAATNFSADFGIGSEVTGSSAILPNRAVDLAQQYLCAQTESQRVVAR